MKLKNSKTRRLLSKADFARVAGVTKQSINRAVKTSLLPAMVDDRIDPNHSAAVNYLRRHVEKSLSSDDKRDGAPTRKKTNGATLAPAPVLVSDTGQNIGAYAHFTLLELVEMSLGANITCRPIGTTRGD